MDKTSRRPRQARRAGLADRRRTRSCGLAFIAWLLLCPVPALPTAFAQPNASEIHDRIAGVAPGEQRVALTLDACSGGFDADLIEFLVRNRIPATIFATKRWIDRNRSGVAALTAHPELFELEDHGENHVPAIIGRERKVYGLSGEPDIVHLRREVLQGARAVAEATGAPPHWYRGAGGVYDQSAADEIRRLGYGVAGFSINADEGATMSRRQIEDRMRQVRGGDVILAHMNQPSSQTAEGLRPALLALLLRGMVFVRLDQVDLVRVP